MSFSLYAVGDVETSHKSVRGPVFLASALIATAACKAPAANPPATATASAPATPSVAPSETASPVPRNRIDPTPDPVTHPCVVVQAKFKKRVDEANGACKKDLDCACYNPVHGDLGCGGVTDSVTAAALRKMEDEFHRLGCAWPHQCAPWACTPKCVSGRCER